MTSKNSPGVLPPPRGSDGSSQVSISRVSFREAEREKSAISLPQQPLMTQYENPDLILYTITSIVASLEMTSYLFSLILVEINSCYSHHRRQ